MALRLASVAPITLYIIIFDYGVLWVKIESFSSIRYKRYYYKVLGIIVRHIVLRMQVLILKMILLRETITNTDYEL